MDEYQTKLNFGRRKVTLKMPDLSAMTLSNFSGDFRVEQESLPRVWKCEALTDKSQRVCRNLSFQTNAQPSPVQRLCKGGPLPSHFPWGLTRHDRSVPYMTVRPGILASEDAERRPCHQLAVSMAATPGQDGRAPRLWLQQRWSLAPSFSSGLGLLLLLFLP